MEVANALKNMFDPREMTFHRPFGMDWSVICEPHDHWRVRVAADYDGKIHVEVSHPAEGEVFKKVYPELHGSIFADIARNVPEKV